MVCAFLFLLCDVSQQSRQEQNMEVLETQIKFVIFQVDLRLIAFVLMFAPLDGLGVVIRCRPPWLCVRRPEQKHA